LPWLRNAFLPAEQMNPSDEFFALLAPLLQPLELNQFKTSLNQDPERAGWKLPWKRWAPHLTQFLTLNLPDAFLLPLDFRPSRDPAWHAGMYYCQEPSAMRSIYEILKHEHLPRRFNSIVDLCSSPGGKTLQLKSLLSEGGVLIANELDPKRWKILAENMERAGVADVLLSRYSPNQLCGPLKQWAQLVLVDAPCSGEALFRRTPSMRSHWSIQAVKSCALRQHKILESACELLCSGGILVYSTCTFNPLENEDVIHSLLASKPEFSVLSFRRFWPQRGEGEGQFVAVLQKSGALDSPAIRRREKVPVKRGETFGWLEVFLESLPEGRVQRQQDKIIYFPAYRFKVSLPVPRQGVVVGRVKVGKKMKIVPTHALAMMMESLQNAPTRDLSYEESMEFLKGRELEAPGAQDGWTLVTYHSQGLGWGKVVQSRMKNHYPSAFRMNS
jgi:16S rRNA C967 or C1407 C5-methylase (RsmB/RsmF family)/NOL1/NOP2/fmu family ribosome biogenesis protein